MLPTKRAASRLFLFAILLFSLNAMAAAQGRYGHLNFGKLIALMPETKAADEELKRYQDSLVESGEVKAKDLLSRQKRFVDNVQGGKLPPSTQKEQELVLRREQTELQQLGTEIEKQIAARRAVLLEPIVKKAESAIAGYARENGYLMIFDTSTFNAVLYAQDAEDLLEPIKARLGLR